MSASDDDFGGEEDQLKRLRSVWVSMRESDEDPPDRGLDALMAAARSKAADMAPAPREGFWTKVLAVFRRPPVLALASVTVLLGGALFIAQRRDRMQAEQAPALIEASRDGAGSAASPVPEAPPASGGAPSAAGPVEANREASSSAPVVVPRDPSPSRARPSVRRSPIVENETPAAGEDADGYQAKGAAAADPAAAFGVGASDDLKQDEAASEQTTRTATTKTPGVPSEPAAATDTRGRFEDATPDAVAARSGTTSLVPQLVKQCESAAARNDCPAVRALAKRIQAADAGAYKQRVAANAAIARCLTE